MEQISIAVSSSSSSSKNLLDLKFWIKTTAHTIKVMKPKLKEPYGTTFEEIRTHWAEVGTLGRLRREFRHHLIAYCELRGMARDRIEKPASNNLPDEVRIAEIKSGYAPVWRWHEDVCACKA